jgi:hypothetical protein
MYLKLKSKNPAELTRAFLGYFVDKWQNANMDYKLSYKISVLNILNLIIILLVLR